MLQVATTFCDALGGVFHVSVQPGASNKKTTIAIASFDVAAAYSVNNGLDFGAQLGANLKAAGDSLSVGVFGRLFLLPSRGLVVRAARPLLITAAGRKILGPRRFADF